MRSRERPSTRCLAGRSTGRDRRTCRFGRLEARQRDARAIGRRPKPRSRARMRRTYADRALTPSSPMSPTVIRFGGGCASAHEKLSDLQRLHTRFSTIHVRGPSARRSIGPSTRKETVSSLQAAVSTSTQSSSPAALCDAGLKSRFPEFGKGDPRERVVPRGRVVPLCLDLTLQPGEVDGDGIARRQVRDGELAVRCPGRRDVVVVVDAAGRTKNSRSLR